MIIKVCGMRDADNIRAVEALGIDCMGFIFWPKSARYVGAKPAYLPQNCLRTGVFVDAASEDIAAAAESFGLDVIQLHGSESPGQITQIRELTAARKLRFVKSISIMSAEDLGVTADYESVCDAFLFDTKGNSPAATGSSSTGACWTATTAVCHSCSAAASARTMRSASRHSGLRNASAST